MQSVGAFTVPPACHVEQAVSRLGQKFKGSPWEGRYTVQNLQLAKLGPQQPLQAQVASFSYLAPETRLALWVAGVERDPSRWLRVADLSGSRPVMEEVVSAGRKTVSMPRT